MKPEEISVISLDWRNMEGDFATIKGKLASEGIQAGRPGVDSARDRFQVENHVTLSGIFPAKGNEASVVYVIGFDEVDSSHRMVVQHRNQAFTAITRARGWCTLTGVGDRANRLFREIDEILRDPDQITFTVPDPKTIQRNLDNLEYERRRNRVKRAQQLTTELARILAEIDEPDLRKQLIEKLQADQSKLL